MTTLKRSVFGGAALVVVLVAVEVIARVYYAVAEGHLDGAGRGDVESPAPAQSRAQAEASHRRHPFEAFTSADSRDERNSYPPHPGGGETLVIGVFGGAVAEDMAPALKQAVAERLSILGVDVEPVVLDFAKDGGRQPQQLMAAIDRLAYGARFHVLVNLDGRNEMNWRRDSTLDHHPRSSTPTMAELELMSEIAALRERQQAARAERQGLGVGALSHLLFGSGDGAQRDLRDREDELAALSARYSLERHGPRREWSADMQLNAAARQWFRSSMLLAKLAEAIGADYYHLLQPSRHIASRPRPGRERPSVEERNRALGGEEGADRPYAAMHPTLVEFGRKLTARGVAFFDLAKAFADADEAVYQNACCRLTSHGNALLAASVLRHIAPSVASAGQAGQAGTVDGGRVAHGAEHGAADQLLAAAHYDIYLRGRKHLVYRRADCADSDVRAPFFLDVIPLRDEDLAGESARRGFERMVFGFSEQAGREGFGPEDAGARVGRRCIVEQRLPNYSIEYLRTGQRDATTREPRWSTWVQFPAAASTRFKVFRRGSQHLVYKKRNCIGEDVHSPFFLHVRPAPAAVVPDLYTPTPDGYLNLDFTVALDDVVQSNGACVFEREVPVEFVGLSTGQNDPSSPARTWQRHIERV